MRYSEDHKAKTRQRIVEEAARRFRRDGVSATGLQALMNALDLTHGGFYAHFKSKDELVEEALRHCLSELDEVTADSLSGDRPLASFITLYLSKSHRADPAMGCPLPTVSAELGQRGQASAVTDDLVCKRLAQLGAHLDDSQDAAMALSAMVGALMLSRSVTDPQLADRLLDETRASLLRRAKGETA
ncbi:TetR/AcrR family transcriptional regulator [Stutzerimonas stutzeri]|uniref:TetR/AcrR family transcriptional regulator n=1 Tax=Stutzerimonas stutzeri TaxID=316 RepID=UPI000C9B4820|nr:TetR/AcrR family transcriptional regulator [Stutzerimonas stutzeri]PNG14769.1 TetR/AcrR family transcriptional regulator [Stutzerimonas stutzeri]